MLRFSPTTPMTFWRKLSDYIPGEGYESSWVRVGKLYGEWRGAHGDELTAAQAQGVNYTATVRTFFHPGIYEALTRAAVIVVKDADASAIVEGVPDLNNPNLYELSGGVDNVKEEYLYMEFRLRRYEPK